MVPTLILMSGFLVLRTLGFLGVQVLDNWNLPLRLSLALMFLVTASAHWGRGRPDLIRMVPPGFPSPPSLVSLTGILEIAGAIGLLIPSTVALAAGGLTLMLTAMFPANIRAAREKLTIMGRPAPPLILRTAMQLLFATALVAAALLHARGL